MRVEELERELRVERPEIDPDFASRLDDWAAAGFPRGGEHDPRPQSGARPRGAGWLAGLRERLAATPPRRILAPAGAALTLLVVVGVAVSQVGEVDGGGERPPGVQGTGGSAAVMEGESSGAAVEDLAGPDAGPVGEIDRLKEAPSTDAGAAESADADSTIAPVPPIPPPGGDGGGVAAGSEERLQDVTAGLVLGAEADEVQDVANDVVAVTDRHDGIVTDSQVASDERGARATFQLEIPFNELDTAIADLSALGDVISRTEATEDITAKALQPERRLAATLQDISELKQELAEESDPERQDALRAEIRFLQATANGLEKEIAGVQRQARFATVNVEITSAESDADEDGWSIDDAVDDAGRVLEVIAGVGLITLAIIVPVTVVGLVAWLAVSRSRQRGRERALDE
jgi:hypothetical protein